METTAEQAIRDLAPEGWTSEHQEHLEALVAASLEEDRHIRWLVAKELEGFLPEYAEAEEQAAGRVQACYEALQDPESDLAEMDKQVSGARARVTEWESKLTHADLDIRADAGMKYRAYSAELNLLHADREKLLTEVVEPLRDAYAGARAALARAVSEREAVELNISDFPYWGLGHKTASYQTWRANAGHLVPVLLSGDELNMEWQAAFEWMDYLCAKSGYRTEGRVPTRAEETKRAIENYLAASSSVQTAPGMADIMAQTQASAKSMQRVPADHLEYAPQVNPVRAVPPDPAMRYQPLRNIRT